MSFAFKLGKITKKWKKQMKNINPKSENFTLHLSQDNFCSHP